MNNINKTGVNGSHCLIPAFISKKEKHLLYLTHALTLLYIAVNASTIVLLHPSLKPWYGPSFFLMNVFFALKGSKHFYSYY